MKLEEQVCTFNQAAKLEHLGVNSPSLFMWDNDGKSVSVFPYDASKDGIKAYTSAELGIMLPKVYYTMRTNDGQYANLKFDYKQKPGLTDIHQEGFNADTEAQARAAMLIHILEAKLAECPLFPEVQPSKTPDL